MLSRNTRLPCRGDCNKSTKVVADSRDPCAMVVYTKCNPTSGPQQSWPFYVFSNWHLACGSSWVWSILDSICGTLAATCHQSTQSGCKMVFFDRRLPNLVQEKQKANAHQCHHSISHELWRQNGNHGPISQRRTYNKFDAMARGNHWQIAMWHQKIVARMPGGDMLPWTICLNACSERTLFWAKKSAFMYLQKAFGFFKFIQRWREHNSRKVVLGIFLCTLSFMLTMRQSFRFNMMDNVLVWQSIL